jgi:hypothetical protein
MWKLFNPHHPITNDNLVMIAFGNVGELPLSLPLKFGLGHVLTPRVTY